MTKDDEIKSLQCGHRERLRKKFRDGQLTEYEILELLLTYAIPRRDVRTLSRQLYNKYGSIHRLLSEPFESLIQNPGVKENTATFLKVLHKLMELDYRCVLDDKPIFHNYEKLEHYCKVLLGGKNIEEFHVLYLDAKYKLIAEELHSSGTVDWTAVYTREIVKRALELNARNIVLVHNHPIPNTSFSMQDIAITDEVANALRGLEIGLYDHLLVSGNLIFSARNLNLIHQKLQ